MFLAVVFLVSKEATYQRPLRISVVINMSLMPSIRDAVLVFRKVSCSYHVICLRVFVITI